jgi:hypothetical protein
MAESSADGCRWWAAHIGDRIVGSVSLVNTSLGSTFHRFAARRTSAQNAVTAGDGR